MKKKTKVESLKIINMIEELYPDAKCELDFRTNLQLLIAVMLSAQTTDVSVNKVTESLFEEYKTLKAFMELSEAEIQEKIRRIGLYKTKGKNLYNTFRMLKENYNGEVPDTYEKLIALPGVGRKTANVVLSNGFGKPAIAVDTHVFRVSNRIGIANGKNVNITEEQLMKQIPKEKWIIAHHLLIWHGRRTCHARKPECENCVISEMCNYYKETQGDM